MFFVFTLLYLDLNDEANEEETCENCNLTKPKTEILVHIGKTKACETHYGARFKAMKAQSKREQKQKSRARIGKENHETLSKKAREKAQKKKFNIDANLNEDEEPTLTCENCRKEFRRTSLLIHITHKSDCKAFYGPKLEEMKKKQRSGMNYYVNFLGT